MLHDEVRPALLRGSSVQDAGDIRVIEHREGLALGLETRDHTLRIHAWLDDLERDVPLDRVVLFGQIHDTHAAFAKDAEQPVAVNLRANLRSK
jgi:hypothetical protein